MVKQNLCWTGHFIPPPPTENASNTLSFERGPWGERGPGRAARARQNGFNFETFLARARGAPRTPFTLRTPFKGNLLLYKVASPGKTPEKTESMLDWPLYTPSPNRECLYKVASPGKTPEKTESMLDWPLYTPSPNRECLYKVASPGKTPEKTESMLDWPLYTTSPNRECLYKVGQSR